MRVTIPTSAVDNTYTPMPEGEYEGTIDLAEEKSPTDDWTVVRISLTDVASTDADVDLSRSRFGADLTIATNGESLLEISEYSDKLPFAIRKTAACLAGLAEGVGVTQRTETGVDFDISDVYDALLAGEFRGERVRFEVSHYTPKNGGRTREQFAAFGAV
jgi:hypothetical protein